MYSLNTLVIFVTHENLSDKDCEKNIRRHFPLLRSLCPFVPTFSLYFSSFSIPVLNISYAIEEQHASIAEAAAATEQISRLK